MPSFPKPRLMLSLALTGGFLLGLAAMYVAETGERGPALGARGGGGAGPADPGAGAAAGAGRARGGIAPQDYVLERPRSRYAEALREVLTGLLLRRAAEAPAAPRGRVVLVTSALPGEGKSTLTLSLARVAAAEGLRVMVIDADLRKPVLHDLVGLKQGAGLVEVLRREVPLADVMAPDPRLPLKLLPGSRRLMQPTRLLGQDGFGALLTALRPSFDLILVDSAPLVAVVDAKLLAKLADAVLFVVRYGGTRRDFCELSLRGLRESGAVVAGAVLSQVDLRRHAALRRRRRRVRLRAARRVLRRLSLPARRAAASHGAMRPSPSSGSRPARPAICTSATPASPWSTGCSRATQAAGSSCASTTPTASARSPSSTRRSARI